MNEFSEYSNPEDNNYDINSTIKFHNYEEEKQLVKKESSQEPGEFAIEIEEDIFEDENIEETLRKFNYDYKSLLRELTSFIDYSELVNILNECGIKKEEYLNPTYVTFEKIRDKVIHNNIKTL